MLLDSMATSMLAMKFPDCVKHLGPIVPGAVLPGGARVPGTSHELDPVQAAFAIGTQIRWLDFNDTWLAAEWGHPSDNLGAILAVADYLSRKAEREGGKPLTVRDVLTWAIKAHEIQGCYALKNSFNRVGLDHVILVRLASTAVVTAMLGGTREQIVTADFAQLDRQWRAAHLSACAEYRSAQELGGRRCLPSRGHPRAQCGRKERRRLSIGADREDLGLLRHRIQGQGLRVRAAVRQLRHGKRAVQDQFSGRVPCPDRGRVRDAACTTRWPVGIDDIERIEIETQEAGVRIIDKTGPLANYADRDHCIQYMVAVPLIFGRLVADDYNDDIAADPRIDALRAKMTVKENPQFTRDYFDPDKRYIGNSLQVFFKDGSSTDKVSIDYPIGHRKRRAEGIPVLLRKFEAAIRAQLPQANVEKILAASRDRQDFEAMPIQRVAEPVRHVDPTGS